MRAPAPYSARRGAASICRAAPESACLALAICKHSLTPLLYQLSVIGASLAPLEGSVSLDRGAG
jgi:hypothetical protein